MTIATETVLCGNESHLDVMDELPPAVVRVTWPSGRFVPTAACQECLETLFYDYVLNAEHEPERVAVVITPVGEPEIDVAALRRDLDMHQRIRLDVEKVLDEALGTEEEDGAGEGMEGGVRLLAAQRDEARAELARLRSGADSLTAKPCGCLSFGEDCDECRTEPMTPDEVTS